jgi:ATP-dependent RNA helicase DeaD
MLSKYSISEKVSNAIADMGFTVATAIQDQAIPHILEGKDIIGQAQTGTGKTAAFAIPMLERIDVNDRRTQALVLCPTRELAIQITQEFIKLSKYMPELEPLAVYGGQHIEIQLRALKRYPQIVIGTPGRIIDHIKRKTLNLSNVKIVALDEADEMLDMGFRDDIKQILDMCPQPRQTLLFSATMPRPIVELSKQYLTDPVHIKTQEKTMTVALIDQVYFEVKERNKIEAISRLIDLHQPKLGLVFCRTKLRVDDVAKSLNALGYKVQGLHGDLRQTQRDNIMGQFRRGEVQILVATDVAARGLDVDDIEIVFNYDIPQDAEYYTHRIGRTARAGKEGKAFTFVSGREVMKLKDISRITKSEVKLGILPSKKEADGKKIKMYMDEIITELEISKDLGSYYQYIDEMEANGIKPKDFIATILKLHTNKSKKAEIQLEQHDVFLNTPTANSHLISRDDVRPASRRDNRFAPRSGGSERPGGHWDQVRPGRASSGDASRSGDSPRSGGYSKGGDSPRSGGYSKGGDSSRSGGYSKGGDSSRSGGYSKSGGGSRSGGFPKSGGAPKSGGDDAKSGGFPKSGGSSKAGGYTKKSERKPTGGESSTGE